jgi:hypothetical protein
MISMNFLPGISRAFTFLFFGTLKHSQRFAWTTILVFMARDLAEDDSLAEELRLTKSACETLRTTFFTN